MSCYVMEKESFARAAGILSAFADVFADGRYINLWMYDPVRGRNMTPDDYISRMMEIYEMNVLSVAESWSEPAETLRDTRDYTATVKKYRKIGNLAAKRFLIGDRKGLIDLIFNLRAYFHSVLYQIDNEEMNRKASAFFYKLLECLMLFMDPLYSSERREASYDFFEKRVEPSAGPVSLDEFAARFAAE